MTAKQQHLKLIKLLDDITAIEIEMDDIADRIATEELKPSTKAYLFTSRKQYEQDINVEIECMDKYRRQYNELLREVKEL